MAGRLTVHLQAQRPLRRLVAEVAHPDEDLDVAEGGAPGGQGGDGLVVRFALADLDDGDVDRRRVGDALRIEDAAGEDDHLRRGGRAGQAAGDFEGLGHVELGRLGLQALEAPAAARQVAGEGALGDHLGPVGHLQHDDPVAGAELRAAQEGRTARARASSRRVSCAPARGCAGPAARPRAAGSPSLASMAAETSMRQDDGAPDGLLRFRAGRARANMASRAMTAAAAAAGGA